MTLSFFIQVWFSCISEAAFFVETEIISSPKSLFLQLHSLFLLSPVQFDLQLSICFFPCGFFPFSCLTDTCFLPASSL